MLSARWQFQPGRRFRAYPVRQCTRACHQYATAGLATLWYRVKQSHEYMDVDICVIAYIIAGKRRQYQDRGYRTISRIAYQRTRDEKLPMEPNRFFKALGDLTRLRMLVLLGCKGELCVCELTHALDEIQPKISRHLAQLREIGVVLDRRQGQWIYYRLNPDLPAWARETLMATSGGVITQPPFNEDLQALTDMPNRPESACCG